MMACSMTNSVPGSKQESKMSTRSVLFCIHMATTNATPGLLNAETCSMGQGSKQCSRIMTLILSSCKCRDVLELTVSIFNPVCQGFSRQFHLTLPEVPFSTSLRSLACFLIVVLRLYRPLLVSLVSEGSELFTN